VSDGRHLLIHREDDGVRLRILGRNIGEPFDISPQPLVVILHDQEIDLFFLHAFSDFFPTPLQFPVGNGFRHYSFFIVHHNLSPVGNMLSSKFRNILAF